MAEHSVRSLAAARWRVAVGETAHSSILSTLRIIDCDPLVVPAGSDDRLTGDALAAVLATDADPASVFAVAATAGTTNAGLIDDLRGIGDVARARDLWFHVDGAYGGAALAAASVRARFDGIERADQSPGDVIVQREAALDLPRMPPVQQPGIDALASQPAQQAVLFRKVEDIGLVDKRGHEQHRRPDAAIVAQGG